MGLDELPDLYDLYVQTVIALYDAGRYAEAIQAFHPESYPQIASDPIIWNSLGLAYWRSGDVAKARESFEKSISIDKAYAVPHNNLGALLLFQFRSTAEAAAYRSAVEHYEMAIALDPAYGAAFHGLGVAFFQAKDYDRAIPNLQRARELDAALDEALYFLGLAYFAKGDHPQAFRVLTEYRGTPGYAQLSVQEKVRVDDYIAKSR
jgi:tetratricopeptide (TPR) repeat protein